MTKKNLLIFIPSIDGWGVEKNFFLITNYLSKNFSNVSLITSDKSIKKKLATKSILLAQIQIFGDLNQDILNTSFVLSI